MRRPSFAALAAVGAFLLVCRATPARAAQGHNELTFDVGAASLGVTHAWREVGARVMFGGGGGLGLSPLPPLGATFATGTHFDYQGVLEFAEVLNAMLFLRLEPAAWLRVDGGARAGFFVHGSEKVSGGEFVGLFLAPALGWRWLYVGPRVSGNVLFEHTGEKAGILVIEYVMLRFVIRW
jgi:hypothetical protein